MNLVEAIRKADADLNETSLVPRDVVTHARALWEECQTQRRRASTDQPRPSAPKQTSYFAPRGNLTEEQLLAALKRFILTNELNFDSMMLYRFAHVPLDASLVSDVFNHKRPLSRDVVGAIVAADWEAAYQRMCAARATLDRTSPASPQQVVTITRRAPRPPHQGLSHWPDSLLRSELEGPRRFGLLGGRHRATGRALVESTKGLAS